MANPFQDPESMLRELRQQAAELETRATRLRDDLAAASATVTSPDGAVTVTLSPTGALQDISFTAKAAAHKPEALGPLVMKTVRAAQGEVSNRVAASLAEQFGDPETMDFITQFMPAPEEPKRSRDEELDGEEFDGNVLRKRQGRVPQDPRTRRPDEGGSLLR
ncbi:YbaB/EbfC family nucleoid-associated protein [Actinophytocola sp.]|uniref:YbaB/EbfC family nucleoid-associated protein n=1 Tax=Actinophytocola sp. TaxID=1872138 RepID=UPI002D64D756|nr:YbaB/EbfC family nucleoid-associated protein [Actinophytocola sp.]HYQ69732.1 YbaB/EbfC family nucleoid-associated protein [Actinophytocola sp.]